MIERGTAKRVLRGTIRRRLLVNAVVDPDEAVRHLPPGIRPHVVDGGTVVGCCLLSVEGIGPTPVPAPFGIALRAAAHRISVEWNDGADLVVGVYVPLRHTDSLPARIVGGRWFPGVHRSARIDVAAEGSRQQWVVEPTVEADRYALTAEVAAVPGDPTVPADPVGATSVLAEVGLSPGRDGSLEAVGMRTDHRRALPVEVIDLRSTFLAGFASARPARSFVMHDVEVTWTAKPSTEVEVVA